MWATLIIRDRAGFTINMYLTARLAPGETPRRRTHRLLCEVAATASNHNPALRPVPPRRAVSGGPRTDTTKKGAVRQSRSCARLAALCHRCAAELAAANFVQVRDQIVNNVPLKDELSVLEGLGAVVAASATYESVVQGTQMLARPRPRH